MTDKCPYCSDYDDLKEELENTRKDTERETKDSLSKCESEKKKLQKQVLGVGTAVIVAATILGQEFVDKVGSYIESFNSVKNAATGVVSQADIPSVLPPLKIDDPKTKQKETKKTNNIPSGYGGVIIPNVALSSVHTSPFHYDLFGFEPYDSLYGNLSTVLDEHLIEKSFDFEPISLLVNKDFFQSNDPFFYNRRAESYDDFVVKASTPVPGPGVLMVIALGIIILKKPKNRRRGS